MHDNIQIVQQYPAHVAVPFLVVDLDALPGHLLYDVVRDGFHMLFDAAAADDEEVGDRIELAQVHYKHIVRLLLEGQLAQCNGKVLYPTKCQ